MRISRKKSKRAKAAELFKTYLEFKAARRLMKLSPILGVAAAAAAIAKRRRSSGEPLSA